MTFYLKYRPQTLDELDLAGVRDNLKKIIQSGSIPHAFLFSGPKGTGKTSAARILAKVVNCQNLSKDGEPCNTCESCISITKGNNIDVIELDAASNRGIDDIRNLKEGISLAPAAAKKKVYIIDEAHMLTLEAANAFLKTLEEPPDHVIFILATTNPEKLPETVISRLTQVNFTKATEEDTARILNRIAKAESLLIDKTAIEKISKLADGSFRDAVKILENLSFKDKEIKVEDINVGNTAAQFFNILRTKDTKKNLEFVEEIIKNGGSIRNLLENIIQSLHASLLAKNGLGKDELKDFDTGEIMNLIELFNNAKKMSGSPIAQLPLEIAIVKFCGNEKQKTPIPVEIKETPKPIKRGIPAESLNSELWQKLLDNIKEKNVSIEALLRGAMPLGFDGKTLSLGVYYQFHKDRLEDIKNTRVLEEVCKLTFETDSIKVIYELIEKPPAPKKSEKPDLDLKTKVDKDIIDAAKEIFG